MIIFYINFLKKVSSYGNIMIITNASKQWIYQTLYYLPKTKELITKYRIISARDNAMKHCILINMNYGKLTLIMNIENL